MWHCDIKALPDLSEYMTAITCAVVSVKPHWKAKALYRCAQVYHKGFHRLSQMKISSHNISRSIVQDSEQIGLTLAAFMQHSRPMHEIAYPQFAKITELEGSDIFAVLIASS
ncbi:MAG: hypothetical protein BWY07_02750 [Candidatus Hydrogenedentes bacterium ADurb.Bin170]|nr:MAG: hypothetical protein BWY07_02750 [Candidatus Hydrogenedentes bacterium ADurb.Bin170]